MKESGNYVALAAIVTCWVIGTSGAQATGDYFVAERGPNHRVIQRISWATNRFGVASVVTNGYTELASGMHFLRDGQWLESRAEIELTTEGAAATNCAHPVRFASDLNRVVAVDLTLPDGRHLRSRVIGLGYYAASGEAVLIAQTRSVRGLLVPPNQVIYTNALAGEGVEVDVQYVVTPAGLEQNIFIHALPPPEAFGLNPASTRLQCLTEFFDPPVPQRRVLATTPDGLTDEAVDFDSMTMPPGRAFAIGDAGPHAKRVFVFKQWVELANHRTILVEQLPFANVREQLDRLPARGGGAGLLPLRRGSGQSLIAALEAVLPEPLPPAGLPPVRMARLDAWTPRGFMLDYSLVSSASNFTFKGDTTYYVANTVNLTGTTRIEGGSVVKFTNAASAQLTFSGAIDCQTGPYYPANFTSRDDNTIGESISGSSGSPTNYRGNGIIITSGGSGSTLQHLRFAYLERALTLDVITGPAQLDLRHVQFTKCRYPLRAEQSTCFSSCGVTLNLDNALAYGCDVFFQGEYGILRAQHLTVNQCNTFGSDDGSDSQLYLTNSLLVAVADWGNIPHTTTTNKVVYYATDPGGIFQTVGSGAHYLVNGSTNRNAGTNHLSAAMLAALPNLTTDPPLVYQNQAISNQLVLYPRAQRDADMPDLGYHYDPLDYAFSGVRITNATVTVNPGTAIAVFSTSNNYGLGLLSGSKFLSTGTPTLPNWIVRSHLVQEQADLSWTNNYWDYSIVGNWLGGPTPPEVQCRFTKWAAAADANFHFSDYSQAMPVWFTDCEFHGGRFKLGISSGAITNALFARVFATVDDAENGPLDLTLRNCLFYGGQVWLTHCESGTWTLTDTLFDQTAIHQDCEFTTDYNGYTTTNRLSPPGAHDVVTNLTYVTGPLGRFYQTNTSRFIQAGSLADAGQVGLYHFTVTTNLVNGWELKETNSIVDIGYHYVAVDTNHEPVDTDSGGVPDYMEDSNGNGTVNSGETAWTNGAAADDFNYQLVPGYLRCEYRVDPWGVDAQDPWTQQQRPRLYWIVTSPRRAAKQTAYQILVATDTNLLNAGTADIWNSGKVYSDRTIHVEYDPVQGQPLQSGQRLWWKVRSWDLHTGLSKWSTNAFFQMGLLSPTNDWGSAKWIGTSPYPSTHNFPCPMFRSPSIVLSNQLLRATAYVTAKGVYEFWINGQKIGPNILAPEWTDINARIQYQTFDLTTNLISGSTNSLNILGGIVGEGWVYGRTDYGNYYGPPNPQFLMRLNITDTDGSTTNSWSIVTDSNWACSTNGPIRKASIYDGEEFDARREGATPAWSTPGYSPTNFTAGITHYSLIASQLVAQPNDPIRIVEYVHPIGMWTNTRPSDGKFVTIYDMGQNMVGWCALALVNTNGAYSSGSNVVIRHAEVLQVDPNHYLPNGPNKTNIYTDNLEAFGGTYRAAQTENYVLNSDTNQQFQPHFTYHGFRFVEVEAPMAVASKLETNSLTGCVIHSGVPLTGHFTCVDTNFARTTANPLLTNNPIAKLMTNAMWTLRGNLQGVFTACTQRGEREGYLFDEHVFSQTACYGADISAFVTKWVRDIRDAQNRIRTDGAYTMYAPWDAMGLISSSTSDPGCQVGGLVFPWRIYQNYADTRMLTEHYVSASKWFGYLAHSCTNSDGTWKTTKWGTGSNEISISVTDWMEGDHFIGLGTGPTDWAHVPPGAAATWETWCTAWCAYSADILTGMSQALETEALLKGDVAAANTYATDQVYYSGMAEVIREAFNENVVETDSYGNIKSFYSEFDYPATPIWHSTSQGDCVTALSFDMIPASKRAYVLTNMFITGTNIVGRPGYWGISNYNSHCSDISKSSNHLSTGYALTVRAMLELTRNGFTTNAYQLLTTAEFPSWLYTVTNGFTTCWEGWNTYVAGPNTPQSGGRGYNTAYQNALCSFNHLPLGAVGEWIWKVVGGINPDDNNVGFQNVIVKPEPGGGITNAFASFLSIHGPIICTWTNTSPSSAFSMNVTVPANSTADIYIPSTNNLANITESGNPCTTAPGVINYYLTNPPSYTKGATVFHVGSGVYRFVLSD